MHVCIIVVSISIAVVAVVIVVISRTFRIMERREIEKFSSSSSPLAAATNRY